jgi:hypothetical protein
MLFDLPHHCLQIVWQVGECGQFGEVLSRHGLRLHFFVFGIQTTPPDPKPSFFVVQLGEEVLDEALRNNPVDTV